MKYIILIGDGMAGYPLKELKNRTTLEAARTPSIDKLLSSGITGLVQNVPEGMPPGSDVASMSIFGFDPTKSYSGRAPLEAAALGIKLGPNDVAFRCNLVSIKNKKMADFTADHIDTPTATKIIKELNKQLGDATVQFYPGVSYRHLVVIKNGPLTASCTPPHDITGKSIAQYLPAGDNAALLNELMLAAQPIIRTSGTKATDIWLWGQGKKPKLTPVTQQFGITGSVITAVDLLKGLGSYAGLDMITVKGATGFIDTNYAGKVAAALRVLKKQDLVIVHIEAPDECGHMGNTKLKIKAIEDFDKKVVGPILSGIEKTKEEFRILVLPDHPTPIALKTHSNEPVPFVFYDSTRPTLGFPKTYSERTAQESGYVIARGSDLLKRLIYAGF
jgi:2,3-bisphosphoglycerate-independent phosphoglycerate mutase